MPVVFPGQVLWPIYFLIALLILALELAAISFLLRSLPRYFSTFKKSHSAKSLAKLAASVLSLFLVLYLMLAQLFPVFVDAPAVLFPEICYLHYAPLISSKLTGPFVLHSPAGDYSNCISGVGSAFGDLSSCEGVSINEKACIEGAVSSGASNCASLRDKKKQVICFKAVALRDSDPSSCEGINGEYYGDPTRVAVYGQRDQIYCINDVLYSYDSLHNPNVTISCEGLQDPENKQFCLGILAARECGNQYHSPDLTTINCIANKTQNDSICKLAGSHPFFICSYEDSRYCKPENAVKECMDLVDSETT